MALVNPKKNEVQAKIGGQIGPRLARRISERILNEVFVFVLTLIGIHLIDNAF